MIYVTKLRSPGKWRIQLLQFLKAGPKSLAEVSGEIRYRGSIPRLLAVLLRQGLIEQADNMYRLPRRHSECLYCGYPCDNRTQRKCFVRDGQIRHKDCERRMAKRAIALREFLRENLPNKKG